MEATKTQAILRTLLVSDLVDSTRLVEELGDKVAARLGRRLDRLARDALAAHNGREIDKSDGFLLLFNRPLDAVRYALEYHTALRGLSAETGRPIAARVGIHLGEVVLRENPPDHVARGAKPLEVEGLAKPMAVRLMSLARAGQTLLTRGSFDVARRGAVDALEDERLVWLAHGGYLFKGVPEPVDVFEVGREGEAPLEPPGGSEKAKQVVEQTTITGWRPAPGLAVPHRGNWVVEKKLGEGGFGEAWLALHEKTRDRRVFKFCHDPESLRALQREIILFRLLKEELGDRDDISRIVDWSFEEAPYFIESEYTESGSLLEWAEAQGGLTQVPLETRLEIVAQVATALAAAHSVGILHKDVKPANVLLATGNGGELRAQLSDFGVGAVTEAKRLAEAGITVRGFTTRTRDGSASSYSGTLLYTAPEILEGKPTTLQSDVYALGVMLYQVVVGDFSRALASGWQREIADELLREDIADAVDGSPERRLRDSLRLAERLRTLASRRRKREAERREKQEAAQLRVALEQARRRRRALALAVTVVVLALFASAMAIMVVRVRREAERTQRVATFLQELFEITNPYRISRRGTTQGTVYTVRDLLDHGREKLETAFKDDPKTRARLTASLGILYRNLGDLKEAQSLLEETLALQRRILGDEHPDIATSLYQLGWVLQAKGDYEGAEPLFRESLEMRRRLLGNEHPEVAEVLNALAGSLQAQGDYEGAEPLYRESLKLNRQLQSEGNPNIASDLNEMAWLLENKGDYEGAEPFFRESLRIWRRLLGDEHPEVADALNNLAQLRLARGHAKEAENLIHEALEIYRKTLPPDHWRIPNAESILGASLGALGHYDEAEPLLVASYPAVRDKTGKHSVYTREILKRLVTFYDAWDKEEEASEYRALWVEAKGSP